MLYTIVKTCSNVSKFILKKLLEYNINSEISLMCCTRTGAVYQNVLDSCIYWADKFHRCYKNENMMKG